ncbi:MAG: hypothetical protein RLZZ244_3056, partial [Verrucomicrobiota bacterium]
QSMFARRWGVNVLPTCWLVDARGVVVSLDASEEIAAQIRALK